MKFISLESFFKSFKFDGCPNLYTRGLSTQIEDLRIIIALCRYFKCKTVLELGVRYGHSARFILEQCPCIEKYIGVDVPYSFVPEKESQKAEVPLQTGIIASSDKRFQSVVLENGTKDLENNPDFFNCLFDLIFIDSDHSMNGTIRETNLANRLVNKNGIIIWHDYNNEKDITDFLNDISKNDDKIIYVEDTLCCFRHCT